MKLCRTFHDGDLAVAEYELGPEPRTLFVLDGAVSTEAMPIVHRYFQNLDYAFCDIDGDETAHVRHLRCDFTAEELEANPLLSSILSMAQRFLLAHKGESTRVDDAYANFTLFGDAQFAHRDGPVWTALYFTNEEWKPDWAGEFLAYTEGIVGMSLAIAPRPGRLLIFDGNILHRGGAPSKYCLVPRITLAYKLAVETLEEARHGV